MTLLINERLLSAAKGRLDEDLTRPVVERLRREADEALIETPPSVVNKTMTPPSGDRRDYLSLAPYWWPDPSKPDGLPYVRKDGQVNPESETDATDRWRLARMAWLVETLTLGSFFFDDERAGRRAIDVARAWFLNPKTGMKPHLDFGQSVPGRVDGRGFGIIDTKPLTQVVDALLLLTDAGLMSDGELDNFKAWFDAYLSWLRSSENGAEEERQANNHGTWYDVQVVCYALFTGKTGLARDVVEAAKVKRVEAQIAADGGQPRELARTRSLEYSLYNLAALFDLARMGENLGVDLWNHRRVDGIGIRRALDFLLPYFESPASWPREQILEIKTDDDRLSSIACRAARAYGDDEVRRLAERLTSSAAVAGNRTVLVHPVWVDLPVDVKLPGANKYAFIERMTERYEEKIDRIPFLNIDPYIIPTPYARDDDLKKDYEHSYVWSERAEILGYLLVYSNPNRDCFHIYKQVTSPFGRGKGIGSAFLEVLTNAIVPEALVYLYIWEKQLDSIDFFQSKGFETHESVVFGKMTYRRMSAKAGRIREMSRSGKEKQLSEIEKLGKIRHDARKNLRLLLDMVNMLSIDNSSRIIEDINRETTALVNLLNDYGERIEEFHVINLKELIIERVIPFVEASSVPCEIHLRLKSKISGVVAHYMDVGRALINLVSNSLDSIREKGADDGVVEIVLSEEDDRVVLRIIDNGMGIPAEKLRKGEDGLPLFVGKTTKDKDAGEGMGTRQIFSTFGAENIEVSTDPGERTTWTIHLPKRKEISSRLFSELESRFHQLVTHPDILSIDEDSDEKAIRSFIWRVRRMELLCYDLVFQFSKNNNIRDIYRGVLARRHGVFDADELKRELNARQIETPLIRQRLLDTVEAIIVNDALIERHAPFETFANDLFASYGQAAGGTIVFTMDPSNGRFLSADRKLVEHLDFVSFLDKDREVLLRGEINGPLSDLSNPVILGVWSVRDQRDLMTKLRLIRDGAWTLLDVIGLDPSKRLGFYHTTYNAYSKEIDSYKTTTLGDMAGLDESDFKDLIISADEELEGLAFAD